MARGTTLADLRVMLRAEIGQTLDTAAATQADNNLNMLLSTKQKWLASSFQWPFLEHRWDLVVPALTRYIALPTTANTPGNSTSQINFEHEVKAEVFFNNLYQDLQYGIGAAEYNIRNPDLQKYNDPIRNWRWATSNTDTSAMQIEVWPVPVTQSTIRFTAQRVTNTLFDTASNKATNDARKADLDDLLLVLMVAADILASEGAPAANLKAALARERLSQLRSKYVQNDEPVILGQARKFGREYRRTVPMVIVAP